MTRDPWKELCDLLDEAGLTVKIGLRQQGHVPTVERMLADGASWDEIGKAIGWTGEAAQRWYAMETAPRRRSDEEGDSVHREV